MQVENYSDLEVWQRGRAVAKGAYLVTREFPSAELYGMTSQIRRAATSIPANIAEGWGRHYPAEFIQFLRKANGSRTELETHLIVSVDVGLCPLEATQPLLAELTMLGKQLLALERSLKRRMANGDERIVT
jgi:four helix bundle protein